MLLSVEERLMLLSMLPREGEFTTLKIVRKLRESLSFSEEEHKLLGFKHAGEEFVETDGTKTVVPNGQIRWNDAVGEAEVFIGEKAADVITARLRELSDQKKLSLMHIDLYEKFIDEGGK